MRAVPLARPLGIGHVRLSVTDVARSKAFYRHLLGLDPVIDHTDRVSEPGVISDPDQLFGGCAFQIGEQVLGLRPVTASPSNTFDSTRVGLDHLSLLLDSVDALSVAESRLADAGIAHGDLKQLPELGLAIVSVQDPDDINVELSAHLSAR